MRRQQSITMKIDDYVNELKRQECMYMPPIHTKPNITKSKWETKYNILKENWKYFIIPSILAYDPFYLKWNKEEGNPFSRFWTIVKNVYYGTKSAIFYS
jgi:hypothetical protein